MKLRAPVLVTAAFALLLAVAAPAGAAGEAFSTEILPDSCQLLSVDVATGVVTEVGSPENNPCFVTPFLARSPDGNLWGVEAPDGSLSLYRFDQTTGAHSKVGELGITSAFQDTFAALTFDPQGHLWFTLNSGAAPCSTSLTTCLYSLDPQTGAATLVGGAGNNLIGGIAADCTGLYAATSIGADLLQVDTATGATTAIGPTGITPAVQGMSFSPDGTLYALGAEVAEGPFHIWTIDPATGAGTQGAAVTGYASNPFDQGGLAMTPPTCAPLTPLVPTPVNIAPAFTG
ncbi:MAG: hypothetical protein U0W40_11555 [Acidimicrobiia bacterium]